MSDGVIFVYFFEVVERLTRISLHIQEIKEQFYDLEKVPISEKLLYVKSYEDVVDKLFSIVKSLYDSLGGEGVDDGVMFDSFEKVLKSIASLHINLHYLPRPSEPLELKRFCRLIDKYVLRLKSGEGEVDKEVSGHYPIYLSERLAESSYLYDPISNLKSGELNKLVLGINKKFGLNIESFGFDDIEGTQFHLSIPRIDASNPCRWPTLIHEVAHKLMRKEYFETGCIYDDFLEVFNESSEIKSIIDSFDKEKLRQWLVECWCDLVACLLIGPSFWFAQYSAFIFGQRDFAYDNAYPSPYFRLRLMSAILRHRFINMIDDEVLKVLGLSIKVFEFYENKVSNGLFSDVKLRNLFMSFELYFLKYFFSVDKKNDFVGPDILNEKIRPLVKYKEIVDCNSVNLLLNRLRQGFPIPSLRYDVAEIKERPAQLQEILFVSTLFRSGGLRDDVCDVFKKSDFDKKELMEIFKRFDMSVLRSIQVSEWFDLYDSVDVGDFSEGDYSEFENKSSGLINDKEIYAKIKDEELLVIPIMNLPGQLGSTSFDIRLGTSLQVYMHTKYGVVDFVGDELSLGNSKTIDLDFLDSFTISPGQFVLGHSMEYIKLPSNMAAQLEGRSSFARLGLQVHMTAGFVDPGFEGVLTFEIYNAGHNPIRLYPGLRVAQLRFMNTSVPGRPYDRNVEAKYGGLLLQHESLQFKDKEINEIRSYLNGSRR